MVSLKQKVEGAENKTKAMWCCKLSYSIPMILQTRPTALDPTAKRQTLVFILSAYTAYNSAYTHIPSTVSTHFLPQWKKGLLSVQRPQYASLGIHYASSHVNALLLTRRYCGQRTSFLPWNRLRTSWLKHTFKFECLNFF